MGLIQAALSAASSTINDQFKDYFYCDSLSDEVLVAKGVKKTSGLFKTGSDNIITNGSTIVVNEGQAMMIVEQGAIVEFSAEPGAFKWDSTTEPSIFEGGLKEGIKKTWETFKKRFTHGGSTANDQRIYFFNIKEILGNKYGTTNPVPFRVVDRNINLDMDVAVRCNGEYSIKITDPILFYKNVSGNVDDEYRKETINNQLKTELLTALQPAFAVMSEQGIRYSSVAGHTAELANSLNDILSAKWKELRGIEIVSFGVNSITASAEDEATIKELQKAAALRDPSLGIGYSVAAEADAKKLAASNANGAAAGFMGYNMAAGNSNSVNLYGTVNQQTTNGWTCSCGTVNTGNFCTNCGSARPVAGGWTCECGTVNTGNFCTNCGKAKK